MSNIISKLISPIKGMEFYKVIKFLYGQYQIQEKGIYKETDFAVFETGAVVEPGAQISHPKRTVLREFSLIHRGTTINSAGGFHLGKYSGVGYNCRIFTTDHKMFKADSIPFDKHSFLKPVFIDDFVMMGSDVCIPPGIRIGEGAIIGMGSVLTRDVPPLAIVMGNPAELIAYRDKDLFEILKEKNAFQSQLIPDYIHSVPLMYKKKYKHFLALIDLEENLSDL